MMNWKEYGREAVAYFKALQSHLTGGNKEEKLNRDSLCAGYGLDN
jgi:hypothetical protein